MRPDVPLRPRGTLRWALAVMLGLVILVGASCAPTPCSSDVATTAAALDFSAYAPPEGADWCFTLLDVECGQTVRHNDSRCAERFSPCSTFKIPHALFALETGAIKDGRDVLAWDGVKRDREALNHDCDLRSAISNSVVWYFQEIARRIGSMREQELLDRIDYGNRDISGGLTQFWLGSSLRISADEQVAFLDRLRRGDLPLAPHSMDIVKACIVQRDDSGSLIYRGKTGSDRGHDSDLGWWVGWVERDGRSYVFAINVSGNGTFGPTARQVAERILIDLGVLPRSAE